MKKLWLLGAVLFALCACNKDSMDVVESSPQMPERVPHFYGWMTLDTPAPETRGVANNWKIWSSPMAKSGLSVKFLNGSERYRQYVKEVAAEWENYADVKFTFVKDDEPALIRVGFDYVRGMRSSWALTGTDHIQKVDNQNEATVHFAEWARVSEAVKRSDVLRAFGQVLGLELEFRHPDFYPEWIVDGEGNIDEAGIRDYWEYALNGLISWEELRKVVLQPLSSQTLSISKTEAYDPESVMVWPFVDQIIQNLDVTTYPEDYNTELSATDKAFIEQLYGPSKNAVKNQLVALISFKYAGDKAKFKLATSKDLVICWDYKENMELTEADTTYVKIPEGASIPYTVTIEHALSRNLRRTIAICESVEIGAKESQAIEKFDLISGVGMTALNIKPGIINTNLSYVRVQGGKGFVSQQFNFEDNKYLKELYLTEIGDSKVNIAYCDSLEVFSTAPYLCKIRLDRAENHNNKTPSASGSPDKLPLYNLIINRPNILIPVDVREPDKWGPMGPFDSLATYPSLGDSLVLTPANKEAKPWPKDPLQYHSINNGGLTISNCQKLNSLCLENTRIVSLDLTNLEELSYLYLSSESSYIVDSAKSSAESVNLKNTLATLMPKSITSPGQIIIRKVLSYPQFENAYRYGIAGYEADEIIQQVTQNQWAICWDPRFEYAMEDSDSLN